MPIGQTRDKINYGSQHPVVIAICGFDFINCARRKKKTQIVVLPGSVSVLQQIATRLRKLGH